MLGFVHTNARTGLRSPKSTHCMVMISSTIAGSSRPVLLPSICGCHVEMFASFVCFSYGHEDDGLLTRVLQLVKPADHAPRMQPIGRAQILAAAVAGRFRLLFRPGEAEPRRGGDGIDEQPGVGREPCQLGVLHDLVV